MSGSRTFKRDEAIRALRDALRILKLPSAPLLDTTVKGASGEVIACSPSYACGYAESAIETALGLLAK